MSTDDKVVNMAYKGRNKERTKTVEDKERRWNKEIEIERDGRDGTGSKRRSNTKGSVAFRSINSDTVPKQQKQQQIGCFPPPPLS